MKQKEPPIMTQRSAFAVDPLVEAIRGRVVSNQWPAGQRVPARRQLAQDFGVSSATLQRGLDQLKGEGFLRADSTRGTYVVEHPPHRFRLGVVSMSPPHAVFEDRFLDAINESGRRLAPRGYSLSTYSNLRTVRDDATHRLLDDLDHHRLTAVLFLHMPALDVLDAVCRRGVPVISFSDEQPSHPGLASVRFDYGELIHRGIAELAAAGARRIGVLTNEGIRRSWQHHLHRACAEIGVETRTLWWQCPFCRSDGSVQQVVRLLMERPEEDRPDGLLITDEHATVAAIDAMLTAGLDVPGDVRVVSHCTLPRQITPAARVGFLGLDTHLVLTRIADRLEQGWGETTTPTVLRLHPSEEADRSIPESRRPRWEKQTESALDSDEHAVPREAGELDFNETIDHSGVHPPTVSEH